MTLVVPKKVNHESQAKFSSATKDKKNSKLLPNKGLKTDQFRRFGGKTGGLVPVLVENPNG